MAATSITPAPIIWIDDVSGNIGTVDISTGAVTPIGNAGVVLRQIAFSPSGELIGETYPTGFYSINQTTGVATRIGGFGGELVLQALVFDSDGTLYATNGDALFTVLPNGAASATFIGYSNLPGDFDAHSMAFFGGVLYEVVDSQDQSVSDLAKINPQTGAGVLIGQVVGDPGVVGLVAGSNGTLYGIDGTNIYSINTTTGAGTLVQTYASSPALRAANGAAIFPQTPQTPPTVSAVTPATVEKTQTTVIGTVTPGEAGDTLTLQETSGRGTLSLGAAQANGTQEVIYTAPASIPASATDTVNYEVTDQQNGLNSTGSATVQLDAGPSVALLPFVLSAAHKGVTIATATPGLPTDTLSLVTVQPPPKGTLSLQGDAVEYTGSISLLSKPVTFSFDLKDQLGGVTPTETVILSNDRLNDVTGGATGNTDVSLGFGHDRVMLSGSGNVVHAGDGASVVRGGVSNNTVTLGGGLDSVTLSGGNNTVTLGNGADVVSVGGSGNKIKLGNGLDIVHGGTDDTINLAHTRLTLYGTNEMVFLGSGAATVHDFSTGIDLKIGPTAGNDVLSDFASDPGGIVDLIGGIGGFTTSAAALAALRRDGHGGALLSFGKGSSLDFAGVALSQLHAASFKIG